MNFQLYVTFMEFLLDTNNFHKREETGEVHSVLRILTIFKEKKLPWGRISKDWYRKTILREADPGVCLETVDVDFLCWGLSGPRRDKVRRKSHIYWTLAHCMPLVCGTLTKRGDCLSKASSPVSPLCQETCLTVNPHSLIRQIVPQISGWTQALPDMVVSHFFGKVSPAWPSLLSVCLCAAWHTGERETSKT